MTDLTPVGRGARALLIAALLASSACIPTLNGLGMRDVNLDMPETFGPGGATAASDALPHDALFDDPHLVALVDEALKNNKELGIFTQEINVSNAEIIARRGKVLPQLDLGVQPSVEKVGRYTSQGASDEADDITPGHKVPENLGNFRIELHASWEIDIWKRLRNTTKAARDRYLASVEGRNFLVTGLVAEISNTYYELVALDRQLEVLQSNIQILTDALEATKLQLEAARVTALAVQRFEAELAKQEGRQFEIRQRIVETENRLNVLVGRYPQHVDRSTDYFMVASLQGMDAGLPSQLLTRRPDVRAAELELEATKLDVKAARARFYPSLSIDARFGIEAFNPVNYASLPASLLYSVAADLLAPLLNRAEIKADYYSANARQMQAVIGYEQTVLLAFVDVANQLAAIGNTDETFLRKTRQVEQLQLAIDTSNQLFRSARADYLEVLTTRSEALEAEIDLVEVRQRQIAARIDLYRALGGGWPDPQS
ncbi:MAG TPA: TolC family protein [Myxococcota bacterium]|nr:TolC family protein [Myxococcota bacterium]